MALTDQREDEQLAHRIAAIQARVAAAAQRAGRAPDSVRIVAVSKTMPAEAVVAAAAHGLSLFGENRVQEAREKMAAVAAAGLTDLRWELIGHLQTNKAARAVELFARVQSVDSLRLAEALEARAAQLGRVLPILLEVNVAGEASKSGLAPDEIVGVARAVAALPHLRPEGLMTVAPLVDDAEAVRPVFRQMRALRETLRAEVPLQPASEDGGWSELSMGMTDDFEVAIEEGATLVRIGRALFGERPPVAGAPEPPPRHQAH
ncbi:MAG TPA: YggS family pyridoxal phosphate-dependent enzyme [Ktedonobacterales bacterium]|nr:YggS family pyridoxal phosphate-dependent enzyme [Ktedonobacterales bacterium]